MMIGPGELRALGPAPFVGGQEQPPELMPRRPLPAEIVFPPDEVLRKYYIPFSYHWLIVYIINLARGLEHDVWRLDGQQPAAPYSARGFPQIRVDSSTPTEIRESADLEPLDWSSFPILVDGTEVVIDFGDWNIIMPHASRHKHWLRFHFHSSYKNYSWLGSFPPATFMDWNHYDKIQCQIRERRDPETVMTILNNQNQGPDRDSRRRRRFMVRGMLHHDFGDRVDFAWTRPDEFYAKAEKALCYVQVPGSWENILDRGQLQMMGLGIPTISPVLIDQCCDGLLQPNVHYLMCRQDYLDVPDLVRWCQKNREEAAAIGHNAWMFFQEFCTPLAVWSYVKDRIDHGAWHARDTIDHDLSPPALYKP
jgi:hypothetical protein